MCYRYYLDPEAIRRASEAARPDPKQEATPDTTPATPAAPDLVTARQADEKAAKLLARIRQMFAGQLRQPEEVG